MITRKLNEMVGGRITFAGEFYVAPVFDELILAGRHAGIVPIAASWMHGLGAPEEVERFRTRAYGAAV